MLFPAYAPVYTPIGYNAPAVWGGYGPGWGGHCGWGGCGPRWGGHGHGRWGGHGHGRWGGHRWWR